MTRARLALRLRVTGQQMQRLLLPPPRLRPRLVPLERSLQLTAAVLRQMSAL
jgi:hypothetical protein